MLISIENITLQSIFKREYYVIISILTLKNIEKFRRIKFFWSEYYVSYIIMILKL